MDPYIGEKIVGHKQQEMLTASAQTYAARDLLWSRRLSNLARRLLHGALASRPAASGPGTSHDVAVAGRTEIR